MHYVTVHLLFCWAHEKTSLWGACIDSLHVVHGLKRQGIGTRLLAPTGEAVVSHASWSGMYLWVLEQNSGARAFTPHEGVCALLATTFRPRVGIRAD